MEEKKDIYILGIESSCDDTSAAVLKNGVLLSNVTASQEVHRAYGGVVPELASRAHQQNVVPVVDQAIARAGIKKEDLSAVDVPPSAQSLHRLRLHICDLRIAYAKGYAAWMDDKQAVTIRDANEKLKEAKTLEHEDAVLVQQMRAKNN